MTDAQRMLQQKAARMIRDAARSMRLAGATALAMKADGLAGEAEMHLANPRRAELPERTIIPPVRTYQPPAPPTPTPPTPLRPEEQERAAQLEQEWFSDLKEVG